MFDEGFNAWAQRRLGGDGGYSTRTSPDSSLGSRVSRISASARDSAVIASCLLYMLDEQPWKYSSIAVGRTTIGCTLSPTGLIEVE